MKALKFLLIIMTLDMFSAGQVSSTATRATLYRMVMNLDSISRSTFSRLDSSGKKKLDSAVFVTAMGDVLALALQTLSVTPDSIGISNGNKIAVPATQWAKVSGRPAFATVATSGAYADLSGAPTIPSLYPWASVTGKPAFSTVSTTGAYSDLSGRPSLATVATSGSYTDLSNKPVAKRQEAYSGVTNASGNYVVTFTTAYAVAPNIQANITNQANDNQFSRITAVSTTGFTVRVFERGVITTLGGILGNLTSALLGGATTPVTGAGVDVIITEK